MCRLPAAMRSPGKLREELPRIIADSVPALWQSGKRRVDLPFPEDSPCPGRPWVSLTVRGPLQELIKPGAPELQSSAKYSDAPSFSLQRSWSPASPRSPLFWGLPGIIQFSMLEGEGKLPELGIEAEFAPFPWLRLAGVGSFSEIPEDPDDEWIKKEGVPVEGELLLGGLRLILKGEHAGLSCFAGASLHRVQPAGGYLRGSPSL